MIMRLATALSLAVIGAGSTVEETWKKADDTLKKVEAKLVDVQEHANDVAAKLAEDAKEEEKSVAASEEDVKRTSELAKEDEEQVKADTKTVANKRAELESSFLQSADSSFLEIPEALAKFPKVAEDMKALHDAEQIYNDKMRILHQKDEELLAMANKDFSESRQAVALMGNLRSQQKPKRRKPVTSFVQKDEMPEAFQRILKAEADLQSVNAQIAKDFHLA